MPDSFKDIPFGEAKESEEIDKILQEHLKIGLAECAEALSKALLERAEELAPELTSLAPYGDYDKLTEDTDTIIKFLKEEATKTENWKILFFFNFIFFNFIFKLYIIVLVLPNIKMNPPQVYMCSPS